MVERLIREFQRPDGGKIVSLPDPNPDFSPEEVLKHYMTAYPELNNASVSGPDVGGKKLVYTFKTSVGSKG